MEIIETVELFPKINEKLITLLKSLDNNEFNNPTQFPDWTVKDICAHLLDTSMRRLSFDRDGYVSQENIVLNSYNDLINHITNLADRWALAFSNVSVKILIELIEGYQNELYQYFKTLNLFETSYFPVSWAGEEQSLKWFDIAREYTERWHHQMQIRDALGKEPLYERELYYPVLNTFMRALPYHFRNIRKEEGYVLCVIISGSAGGSWFLEWSDKVELATNPRNDIRTEIIIPQENAWKICTRWIDRSAYIMTVNGDEALGEHMKSINCLMIKS
jgi:Mycothiol maleylpyruvate isomerase N-terminal domain.